MSVAAWHRQTRPRLEFKTQPKFVLLAQVCQRHMLTSSAVKITPVSYIEQ
jgi:hypothetical protein